MKPSRKLIARRQQSANQEVCLRNKMAALFLPLLLLSPSPPLSILFTLSVLATELRVWRPYRYLGASENRNTGVRHV